MIRFREILKGTTFEDRINILIEDSKNKWLRSLGKNDFIHSEEIENYLDKLVPDKIKRNFDKAEILVLLSAVYLHDIGRITNDNSHEKETYDMILASPEKYGFENRFVARAVAEVCYGHAKESERSIKSIRNDYAINGFGNKPLNLQFLAGLLRIADELDNTYRRVQGVKNQESSKRHLIRSIDPLPTRRVIEVQSELGTMRDVISLLKIVIYTQKRLDEVKEILESNGICYDKIRVNTKDFSTIQEDVPLEKFDILEKLLICEDKLKEKKIFNDLKNFFVNDISIKENFKETLEVMKELCKDNDICNDVQMIDKTVNDFQRGIDKDVYLRENFERTLAMMKEIHFDNITYKSREKTRISYQLDNAPDPTPDFINRQQELEELMELLSRKNIIIIQGKAGIGKTELAAKMRDNLKNKHKIYWKKINSMDTFKSIVINLAGFFYENDDTAIYQYIENDGKDYTIIVKYIINSLNLQPYVLFFDDYHEVNDPKIDSLFSELKYKLEKSKVIITTRVTPYFINSDVDQNRIFEKTLKGFDLKTTCEYLFKKSIYLSPEQLHKIYGKIDGDPSALLYREFSSINT